MRILYPETAKWKNNAGGGYVAEAHFFIFRELIRQLAVDDIGDVLDKQYQLIRQELLKDIEQLKK